MSQPLNKSENGPTATGSDPGLPNRPNNTVTPNPARPYTPVFTADKISESKAKKPREFFDEQNRKSAEQKKQNAQNRKKLVTILVGIAIVFALVIVIWLVILKVSQPNTPAGNSIPTVSNGSNEEVNDIRQYLQNIYNDTQQEGDDSENSNTKLEAANEAAEEILNHGENSEYASQITLARISFYLMNGYYNEIIAEMNNVNIDDLTLNQKAQFYNCVALAYQALGNQEKSEEYFNLTFEATNELSEGEEDHGE